jgi:hypothetical protein
VRINACIVAEIDVHTNYLPAGGYKEQDFSNRDTTMQPNFSDNILRL